MKNNFNITEAYIQLLQEANSSREHDTLSTEQKVANLKMMDRVVRHFNNEELIDPWLSYGVPDGASEDDYYDIATETDSDFDYYKMEEIFIELLKEALEDGLFEADSDELAFAQKYVPDSWTYNRDGSTSKEMKQATKSSITVTRDINSEEEALDLVNDTSYFNVGDEVEVKDWNGRVYTVTKTQDIKYKDGKRVDESKNSLNICPKCNSTDISYYDENKDKDGTVHQFCNCMNCNNEFEQVYDKDGNFVKQYNIDEYGCSTPVTETKNILEATNNKVTVYTYGKPQEFKSRKYCMERY